jgi:hypothetical protein
MSGQKQAWKEAAKCTQRPAPFALQLAVAPPWMACSSDSRLLHPLAPSAAREACWMVLRGGTVAR